MDLYSPYSKCEWAWKTRQFWACFSRQISDFWLLFLGRTKQSIQLTVGMEIKVQNRPYSNMDLARKSR
jgi:hypothetical protein